MNLRSRLQEICNTTFGQDEGAKAKFAREIGVSRSAISQLLAGTVHSLKAETALKIQDKTGYSARWLVLGSGPRKVSDVERGIPKEAAPLAANENKLLEIIRAFEQADIHGKDAIWAGVKTALKRHASKTASAQRQRPPHSDGR